MNHLRHGFQFNSEMLYETRWAFFIVFTAHEKKLTDLKDINSIIQGVCWYHPNQADYFTHCE